MDVTIGIAFLAGLASFLSPCIFPLIPAYVGYLGGRTLNEDGKLSDDVRRWNTIFHGIAFILGFSTVFVLLGLTFSIIGGWLFNARDLLSKIGGIIVFLFGIHTVGLYRFKFLEYDLRYQNHINEKVGYISSFIMGVLFSAGWSPCIGPVLASVLTIAMNSGDPGRGIALLSSYSAGMAIPFLLASVGISWVSNILIKYKRALRVAEISMGIILITVGILLFTGAFAYFSQIGTFLNVGI